MFERFNFDAEVKAPQEGVDLDIIKIPDSKEEAVDFFEKWEESGKEFVMHMVLGDIEDMEEVDAEAIVVNSINDVKEIYDRVIEDEGSVVMRVVLPEEE